MLLAANIRPVTFEPMLLTANNYHWWNKEYWSEEAKAERQAEKEAKQAAKEAEKAAKKAEKEAKKEAKEDKKAINEDFQANVDLEMGGKIKATAKKMVRFHIHILNMLSFLQRMMREKRLLLNMRYQLIIKVR